MADDLTEMISEGDFPLPGEQSDLSHSPRVGDGLIRTDADGKVTYASPNGVSAYRRLGITGDLVGTDLVEVTQALVPAPHRPTDQAIAAGTHGPDRFAGRDGERRCLAAACGPSRCGRRARRPVRWSSLRDVTELRLRERELVCKEATIREIHHRVKNNLQTVQALCCACRDSPDGDPEARAALEEAVRRIGSIAVVHETLSQSFDEIVAVRRDRRPAPDDGRRGGLADAQREH